MNEENEFLDFVKGRLEGEMPHEPPRFDAIMYVAAEAAAARASARRSHRRLWGAMLAAASLAVAFSLPFVSMRDETPASENTIAEVIDLLRTEGGGDSVLDNESAVDMLLAWQDAPYERAIDDLRAEN